jgi:methionyl-tRNA synthetase
MSAPQYGHDKIDELSSFLEMPVKPQKYCEQCKRYLPDNYHLRICRRCGQKNIDAAMKDPDYEKLRRKMEERHRSPKHM